MHRLCVALLTLTAGCLPRSSSSCDLACTALFAMVTVRVVDGANLPVNGLTTRTTYVSTNELITTGEFPNNDGLYVVVDDNLKTRQFPDLDPHRFSFVATSPTLSATAEFVIGGLDDCECHVEKLGGPDTIMLQ